EMLPDRRDALGRRVGQNDADVAVAAAHRCGADARQLLAAHPEGGLRVDHEGLVVEVAELPAPRRLDRSGPLVAGLDALLLAPLNVGLLAPGRLALEI